MGRSRRIFVVLGAILGIFALYEIVTSFVAYTDDAYVRSDLVAVAPEITGRIIAVHVVDNEVVKVGDKLVSIDPVPFQLVVNQRQAEIQQATALEKTAKDDLEAAEAALTSANSALVYATQTQQRLATLAGEQNAPRAALDRANDDLRRAEAQITIAKAGIAKAHTSIAAQKAAINRATAELATANWELSRTDIVAPVAGPIVNLTVRIGDTGTANVPLIGIVDAAAFRIMANYKQDYVRSFKIGDTAWVWLDSQPWHLHRGRIDGIARGISREKGEEKLLPYVAPTTDWIRLQRRIPVTITLVDPPPELKLYMGADSRTVIFP